MPNSKETKKRAKSYGKHRTKEDERKINNRAKVKRAFRPKAFSIAPDTSKHSTFSTMGGETTDHPEVDYLIRK